jgi:sugar phosphate permease
VPKANRWVILTLGLLAQAATCAFLYGIPMLVPQLRAELHLSLTGSGVVVGAPAVGLLLTLIAWGALADRYGERVVIASGLLLATAFLCLSTPVHSVGLLCLLFVLAGASCASVNAASGRVVLGWFAAHERGLAMGVRQTAQPLGVAFAALVLPSAAQRWGAGRALLIPAGACALIAVLVIVFVIDPPRAPRTPGVRTANPYRTPTLYRVHAASTMLVVPQFAVSAFSLVYLVSVRHWDAPAAGRLLFCAQLLGAAGRIGSGRWSDRVASRLTPMRQLAVASALVMAAFAVGDAFSSPVVVVILVIGAVVTVADNGLAFTAVAEFGGSAWAGRALGTHNTVQNLASALTPPLLGALVTAHGYGWGFAVVAVFPLLAIGLTPVADERRRAAATIASRPAVVAENSARAES